ncbi:transglycosylase [Brachybacterium endophyticum]|uniref:Transglycosylase n=1 Tax=Brachybacterium endophyticum TaxID=2182385 RepID=A0A2U2RGU5_9MICO|nr:transglycosylase family protein [Brachybacterium endophyticum]PWH05074.1 transglycosylase [Brachybacterium endophyticum]
MTTHESTSPLNAYLRRGAIALAGGAVIASGMMAANTTDAHADQWDKVAQCESTGNWSANTGNGFKGGLQFTDSTWKAYGGQGEPQNASKSQQKAVAERVLAGQGKGAWPVCGTGLSGSGDSNASIPSGGSSSSSSSDHKSTSQRSSSQESTSQKQSSKPQGSWNCDGDGIADNCTENGFTKKTEKKSAPQQQSTSSQKQSSQPQGSWNCDGDGIADNCTADGFTKKTEKKSAPQQSTSSKSDSAPGVAVAGNLDVDGKMGPKTVSALQDWLNIDQTGKMDAQTVKAVQAWTGNTQDGKLGNSTVKGIEHQVGASQNGGDELDGGSVKTLQAFLNLY